MTDYAAGMKRAAEIAERERLASVEACEVFDIPNSAHPIVQEAHRVHQVIAGRIRDAILAAIPASAPSPGEPDRLCYVHCGLPGDQCACWRRANSGSGFPASAPWTPPAWADVIAERRRQVEAEGWTPEHDDAHTHGELAMAGGCYALASCRQMDFARADELRLWPWSQEWWKPTDRRRDLVKAAALLLAEIERLDRLPPASEDTP